MKTCKSTSTVVVLTATAVLMLMLEKGQLSGLLARVGALKLTPNRND